MSVHGEFQRILGELADFLERTGGPGCDAWARELQEAGSAGRKKLSDGASRAFALLQGDSAPTFVSPLEIEEFARLQEHLTSLCRVILGR
ncbi:MAG: hypothetical protein ACR2P8_11695 [Myxococcota bacterium]